MNNENSSSYRDEFRSNEQVKSYDEDQYGARTWSTLLWQLEKDVLSTLMGEADFVPTRQNYLDFACGTGRVTAFLAPHFESSKGLDISPEMLERACRGLPETEFVCTDVSTGQYNTPGDVDLITSFRFLLNAVPSDQLPALRWMRSQLRDDQSRLIINNHGNSRSHKVLPYIARRVRHQARPTTGNILSHRSVAKLAHQAGFRLESAHGVGHLGGTSLKLVGPDKMMSIQRRLNRFTFLDRFAEDQLYVLAPC